MFTKRLVWNFCVALLISVLLTIPAIAKEKVILDTDMVMMYDDGVAMIMLARHPEIELLGVVTVAGNTWIPEGTAYALRQLELIGRSDIPVAEGARFPLRANRYETIELERQMFGIGASSYIGCFGRPEPASYLDVYKEKFGGEPTLKPIEQHGVNFLIETIKANPGEVTVIAIGPCTNLAMAIRLAPEIIPMVKRVVYMGGAIDVPGNTTPAAEFNWWFDPEAAKMTIRAPFADQLIVGLDVCEKYRFNKAIFDRVTSVDTPVTKVFKETYGPRFEKDANFTRLVWDTIAATVTIDPTLITEEQTRWVDVNADYNLDYGRSLGYKKQGPAGTQQVRILFTIDEERFWNVMVDLLTQQ
ncbi:inosine-uridine preferring nucleoside hydrolase [Candidatus Vecturithrix granuli]|uniref:Inosine-uridine preferring nucleoside hydrolase n=1 Tax=Vecturithrix granuli TaxID=1499967 RepID=A0A081C1W2_VECG1|nr:inosine-uridine preferring nucleoside hydrolase [Candidatus Vecturithrix granuli]